MNWSLPFGFMEILLHSLDVDTGESLFRMGEELGLFNSIQNIKGIKHLDKTDVTWNSR